ncbi:helix-turn-helix domain-containing protein [Terasakiella sp.]|uniref:helix-turn-helix domain-containing protein n=1 Tax=Terasakiella sp. TaxID=2034861 RepID=UPI003AA7FA00
MSRTLASPLHKAIIEYLIRKRKEAGLTQAEVAARLNRYQSFVATVEQGQRKIDVVDLFLFGEAIGFDPVEAIIEFKRITKLSE